MAAASRTMKWEHIGTLDKLWLEAGVVPPTDEIRSRWLGEGAGEAAARRMHCVVWSISGRRRTFRIPRRLP